MSPYTWKNDVCLRGMIPIFIRFCHQFIHKIPFQICFKISELLLHWKPGSHMSPIYLEHSRQHSLGQRCICERLSPTHNLSQVLTGGLPANLSWVQPRRQAGGQCLGQITVHICRNVVPGHAGGKWERGVNETDENDLFGRNIQAANLPPITIYDRFFYSLFYFFFNFQKYTSFASSWPLLKKYTLIKVDNVKKQLESSRTLNGYFIHSHINPLTPKLFAQNAFFGHFGGFEAKSQSN